MEEVIWEIDRALTGLLLPDTRDSLRQCIATLLEKRVAEAVAQERESCAKIIDREVALAEKTLESSDFIAWLEGLAGEIRDRGKGEDYGDTES